MNQPNYQTNQTKPTNQTQPNQPTCPKNRASKRPSANQQCFGAHATTMSRHPNGGHRAMCTFGEQFAGLGAIHNCAVLCSVGNTSVYELPNIRADSILCDQQVWAANADSLRRASTATRPTKPTWRAYWSSTQALPTTPGPVKTACCETHLLFTTM